MIDQADVQINFIPFREFPDLEITRLGPILAAKASQKR
jgi:hypothetical protein